MLLDELERTRIGPLVVRKRAAIERDEFPADSRLKLLTKDMEIAQAICCRLRTAAAPGAEAPVLAGEAVAA